MTKEEENHRIFDLLLQQLWGDDISTSGAQELHTWKQQSPQHAQLAQNFGDLGWINNGLSVVQDFPKELIRQRIEIEIAAKSKDTSVKSKPEYTPVIAKNTHIRVHRLWRIMFVALFLLSKLLLFLCIYQYYTIRGQNHVIRELQKLCH